MTEKELKKQYYKEWQEKQPTKYVTWLVFYYGSLVPVIIALAQILGGLNDGKAVTMMVCYGIWIVMEVIALILAFERNRGWKEYRKAHLDQLQGKK